VYPKIKNGENYGGFIMNELIRRFWLSLGFVFGGLHLVWLGCKWSGADDSRINPVWGFLNGLVTVEYWILVFLFFAVLTVGAMMLLHHYIQSIELHPKSQTEILLEERLKRNKELDDKRQRCEFEYQKGMALIRAEPRQKRIAEESYTPPVIPKPTPEELKEKAIGNILRGNRS